MSSRRVAPAARVKKRQLALDLDALVARRLGAPEVVHAFGQVEELGRQFGIEPPYAPRTSLGLGFDVYDARRLLAPNADEEEPDHVDWQAGEAEPGARALGAWCGSFHLKAVQPSMRCCLLSKSDTTQEFGQVSPAVSSDQLCADLQEFETEDREREEPELHDLATQLVGSLVSRCRRPSDLTDMGPSRVGSSNDLQQPASDSLGQQQQVILDAPLDSGCTVSVCLLDKRQRTSGALQNREADNGRRWARLVASLAELHHRLASNGIRPVESEKHRRRLSAKVERFLSRRRAIAQRSQRSTSGKLSKELVEQLIEGAKANLNHLIDAQLLLRNKLANASEQAGSLREADYELLLRNNFNLLKIWQNLEESKHVACFVSEPIKASLADLFWFNRQRPTKACELALRNSSAGTAKLFFVSPLACLDAIQVKRGILQILEALNYLHSICKLIHRNLNPGNVLIASNGDNWKLSGLEFAIRFESATVHDSASIMAGELAGSTCLRYTGLASTSGAHSALRRQRTLCQTKCEEFVKKPRARPLIQPELDYLAPEIWRQARCSHKSDLFSFGLLLAQTYDLWRHRAPISCQFEPANYELELRKLNEQATRRKLCRRVPFEMRSTLTEMLDMEPNLRPSANYALQLLRRPIELCKSSEHSLRHLRSSLSYMDPSWLVAKPTLTGSSNINNVNYSQHWPEAHRKRINYFRKVTFSPNSANRDLRARRQPKSLHLLNLLLRALDSASVSASTTPSPGQSTKVGPFGLLRRQFERTYECLLLVCGRNGADIIGDSQPLASILNTCADSSSLMLLVALHRRLLDQVGRMRAEVPPICRLTAANSQANRPLLNHKLLADMEDRLSSLASRVSIGLLAPALADPLLKIEEFLLVQELLADLLAFVALKNRQALSQRGRQLLAELTPVNGYPSLSSSEEDEPGLDACELALSGSTFALTTGTGQRQGHAGRQTNRVDSRDALSNLNSNSSARMNQQRFTDYIDEPQVACRNFQNSQQQNSNLLTKISITAPSPMGSVRDVNRLSSSTIGLDSSSDTRPEQGASSSGFSKRHQLHDLESELVERTSQLTLADHHQQQLNLIDDELSASSFQKDQDEDPQEILDRDGERSRSQLIDELLKTINDDSFNNFVDLNNKYAAKSATCSPNSSPLPGSTAGAPGSSPRPKSAMDSVYADKHHGSQQSSSSRQRALGVGQANQKHPQQSASAFDNVIRRMSTNLVQNFNKMSTSTLLNTEHQDSSARDRGSSHSYTNSLYVDNQVPVRRHSDNTINIPRIQVALSSPQTSGSRSTLNQRASVSASKLANKWKLTAKTNQRESTDKLSPNIGGALGYMRRHSSGNTTGNNNQGQSNGPGTNLLFNSSPFKTRSSSNLGLDFLISNRSMKRRCSAASMLGHQTQRKAEDLIDAGMKSVQNMFS